jgi:hypothetical protein
MVVTVTGVVRPSRVGLANLAAMLLEYFALIDLWLL